MSHSMCIGLRRKRQEVEGAGSGKQDHDADDEAHITDTVCDKSLNCGGSGRWTVLGGFRSLVDPEANQQIGTQAYKFPPYEDDEEVLGEDDIQHGKGEEREV